MTHSGLLKLSGLFAGLLLTGIIIFAVLPMFSHHGPKTMSGIIPVTVDSIDSPGKTFDYNGLAFFLAGIKDSVHPDQFPQVSTKEWKTYASRADSNWAKFFKRKINPVRSWQKREIPPSMDTIKTVFYPFGGPDYIFADAFFPQARNYILFGLESPGEIPDISAWKESNLTASLALLNKSIDDVTSVGFFRTNDMRVELASASIHGVTPILMLFLVRSGHHITDVIPGEITAEGGFRAVREFQNALGDKGYGTAVEIRFTENATGARKTLLYFSVDVSDEGLAKNNGCKRFLEKIDTNCITFIKSASYLMHLSDFSVIRKTILSKSRFILQDDSGLPYRMFRHDTWQIRLYGTYSRTIDLFKHKYQEDLKEAYDKEEKPGNVPFKIGYNVKFNETNLQMAIRKERVK